MPVPEDLLATLRRLRAVLDTREAEVVTDWLTTAEAGALTARIDELIEHGTFPVPSEDWPSIPWPVF